MCSEPGFGASVSGSLTTTGAGSRSRPRLWAARRWPRLRRLPHPLRFCVGTAARRVQKYERTLRPARRAVVEFIYHYCGERHHQGLGNAFVFLVTTGSFAYGVKESVSVATYSPSWAHSAARSIPDVVARRRATPTAASTASPRHPSAAPSTTPVATPERNIAMDLPT